MDDIWSRYRDEFTEEFLRTIGLSERQMKAVLRINEKEKITNKEYQEIYGVSRATATRELSELIDKHVLVRAGRGKRDLHYIIKPFMMQKKFDRPDRLQTIWPDRGRNKGGGREIDVCG